MTVDDAFLQAFVRPCAGRFCEAEPFYQAIFPSRPNLPGANQRRGILLRGEPIGTEWISIGHQRKLVDILSTSRDFA